MIMRTGSIWQREIGRSLSQNTLADARLSRGNLTQNEPLLKKKCWSN